MWTGAAAFQRLGLSVGDTTLAGGYYVPITDASFAYALLRVPGDPVQFADPIRRALATVSGEARQGSSNRFNRCDAARTESKGTLPSASG